MPPSGYPRKDAETLAAFLSACATALEAECNSDFRALGAGLDREIAAIDSVLERYSGEPFALSTLRLTRVFYVEVRKLEPASPAEYQAAVRQVLEDCVKQIVGVHVAA